MTTFKLGEIFCGPGGIAYGALQSRIKDKSYKIEHQWATDYDKDTCNTYRLNICPDNPNSVIQEDIRNLNFDQLDEIDALVFGFPCNDFSLVGEQKGIEGQYGSLYKYGVKALRKFQPKWFLAENVSGLKNMSQGKVLMRILEDLEESGYVLTPHLYKFEEYKIPQNRHRIIIVGVRKDLNLKFKVPKPHTKNEGYKSSFDAINNPPIPSDAKNNELTRQSQKVIRRLMQIKPGENAFNADLDDDLKLNVKGAKISQIYKRLEPDKPAYTVTGSGGGGTHMYHWSEPRALTNRERARLQTFPDHFVFHGNKESVRKQIGMAVPVEGAQIIIESILKTFAKEEYESINQNID